MIIRRSRYVGVRWVSEGMGYTTTLACCCAQTSTAAQGPTGHSTTSGGRVRVEGGVERGQLNDSRANEVKRKRTSGGVPCRPCTSPAGRVVGHATCACRCWAYTELSRCLNELNPRDWLLRGRRLTTKANGRSSAGWDCSCAFLRRMSCPPDRTTAPYYTQHLTLGPP